MAAARESPDIAFEIRQKLDIDVVLRGRNVVAERVHGVGRGPLRADVAQRIARSGSDDAKVGLKRTVLGFEQPAAAGALDFEHARFRELRSSLLGALEQHVIEIESRVDNQRTGESHLNGARFRRGEVGVGNDFLGRVVFEQKRILMISLVGESAAAGFFPGQLFIEDERFEAGIGETFCSEGSGRPAAQDGDALHLDFPAFLPGSTGGWSVGNVPEAAPLPTEGWPVGMAVPRIAPMEPDPESSCGGVSRLFGPWGPAGERPLTTHRVPFRSRTYCIVKPEPGAVFPLA